jgi:hypothetical protein
VLANLTRPELYFLRRWVDRFRSACAHGSLSAARLRNRLRPQQTRLVARPFH